MNYKDEIDFWGNCCNTIQEEDRQFTYAHRMGLKFNNWYIDVMGKSILDVGGGPVSLLLKTFNLGGGKVVDPITYPVWTNLRYESHGISVNVQAAEDMNETGYDEVWMYNCLQHTIDPERIIENIKRAGKVLRIFEWINIPAHAGHPQELKEEKLNAWIGQKGQTETFGTASLAGTAYFGTFNL